MNLISELLIHLYKVHRETFLLMAQPSIIINLSRNSDTRTKQIFKPAINTTVHPDFPQNSKTFA